MADVQQALGTLRETIAGVIARLEVWGTLHAVREALGLPAEEVNELGKHRYLQSVTAAASDQAVIRAAARMLSAYPGTREKPTKSDIQVLQHALWWIENHGVQRISNVTRYGVAEILEGIRFWGRLSFDEFATSALPASTSFVYVEAGNDGFLYQTPWSLADLGFGDPPHSEPRRPSRISILQYLVGLGLKEWPDQQFCLLIDRMVHPEVQTPDVQQLLVAKVGPLLERDGFELRQEGLQSGYPVYRVHRKEEGVSGSPKYVIFASTGPKPDIVVDDAVSMDIRVVRHADQCLIYDEPPPNSDLTWQMLVEWWGRTRAVSPTDEGTRRDIGRRLRASLQSEPERILFDTYFKAFRPRFGAAMPALLPQVYLHYDPRNQRERDQPALIRQRMDFLMLLRNTARIVIEIDGAQHYSDVDGHVSPYRYAEMVAEDRRIRLLGYEIYRFGGAEFEDPEQATQTIITFFEGLFDRHDIHPKSGD